MNKGNLNKLVTNYPVSLTNEEVENLSLTLSAVRTAGGGGGEGKTYTGEGFVSVNNTNNTISLTTEADEKLNQPIPTKVSDLTDSANYQTTAGMASYETTQHASQTYLTKSSADNDYAPLSTTADVDALKEVSGDFSLYYKKTETSSKEALETAFGSKQDNLTQEQLSAISSVSSIKGTVLVGDSNILAASAEDGNNIKWTLELTAQPTVTDTTLSGYDGIVATKDSSVSSRWNVGIAQAYKEQIEAVSSKLTQDDADTLYAPISVTGDVDTLKSSSGDWNEVSAKLDTTAFSDVSSNFLTAHQSLADYYTKTQVDSTFASATQLNNYLTTAQYQTDSGTFLTAHQPLTNYYQKIETSSKGELSAEFAKYVTSSNVTTQDTDYVMTTTGWKVLTLPGGGMTQVIHDDTLTGQGNANDNKLGVAWSALSGNTINSALSAGSATSALSAEDANSARYTKQLKDASKTIQISDITALQNWASSNSSTWDGVSAKLGTAQYANDSATFVTKPDTTQTVLNNNYLIYSTLTDPTATTGWMPLSANYYSKTEADGRYQKILDMGNYLTTAKYATDSATFVTSSSNTITGTKQYALTTTGWSDIELSAYLPLSGGTVSGQLEVHGGSNFDSQFIKLTREGNSCGARIGLGSDTTNGTLALKTFNGQGQNTVQVNIKHNTNNNELIQVQKGGTDVGFLIPAVTATTTAGLTNDGILHIILES